MTSKIKVLYPDRMKNIGIAFIDNDGGGDARKFIEFMRGDSEVNGQKPFHQGSDSRFQWDRAEKTEWEFFEYLHVANHDNEATDAVINVAIAASEATGIELA